MSHVLLDQTLEAAKLTAKRWEWHEHSSVTAKSVNRKGEEVLFLTSADRARQALRPGDKLYLGSAHQFCHGNANELIRNHRAVGGAVFYSGEN